MKKFKLFINSPQILLRVICDLDLFSTQDFVLKYVLQQVSTSSILVMRCLFSNLFTIEVTEVDQRKSLGLNLQLTSVV